MKPLEGCVALVAGATRGAGRGIACALGEAGAAVYCTGRSVRGRPATPGRPETIEETAEMVSARGGVGIHVRVDHTEAEQVEALFERVAAERGRLDVLVNDVWGGDPLTEWGKSFWEMSLDKGLLMLDRAINAHVITSRYGVPLLLKSERGLVVEVTDGDDDVNAYYRGNLFYDLAKIAPMRLAFAMAHELRDTNVTAVALSPGFLRSEYMLDHFAVSEENWRDAIEQDEYFAESETPHFIGRAIVALATDPRVSEKSGRSLATWSLAREYGFTDVDGRRPDVGGKIARDMEERWNRLVAAVREKLTAEGVDPDSELRHDLSSLKLSRRRKSEGGEPEWYTRPLLVPELWSAEPTALAEEFLRRYGEHGE